MLFGVISVWADHSTINDLKVFVSHLDDIKSSLFLDECYDWLNSMKQGGCATRLQNESEPRNEHAALAENTDLQGEIALKTSEQFKFTCKEPNQK